MRTEFLLIACLLLLGCTGETSTADGGNGPIKPGCREISYETTQCGKGPYSYSNTGLEKLSPYVVEVHCIGGATVTVRNLEKQKGTFIVTFIFETPIEGKVTKKVEKEIGPGGIGNFEEKFQFRCSQEYSAGFSIEPPLKPLCRVLNETRQECTGQG